MAEKLSIQIALQGGAEVERQLADIGAAGQQAFADIEQSAAQVGGFKNLKPEVVTEKLKTLGIEGTAAFEKIQQAVATAGRFEKIVLGITALEKGFAAAGKAALKLAVVAIPAVTAAVAAATKSTIAFADSINKISEAAISVGMSFEQFNKIRTDLTNIGLSAQDGTSGIQAFQKSIDKINAERIKELRERLVELGYSVPILDADVFRMFGEQARTAAADIGPFIDKLRQMPDGAERSALAIERLGTAAGTALIQSLKLADPALSQTERSSILLEQAFNRLSTAWTNFGSLTFAPGITAAVDAATNALVALQAAINNFKWDTFTNAAMAAGNALKYFSAAGMASLAIQWSWDTIVAGWDALTAAVRRATQAVMEFLGLKGGAPAAPAAADGTPAMAGGGLLGGRGTGTSDSNLAWVSRGEHIMPARAVAQPGVLAFLEALRRSGGNLSRVLDGMGRFALGGLVPRAIPAYAAGGLAGGGNHVTIQFPGLPAISGLRASSNVVEQLHKAAALAQVRSGGRKPSRYS